MLGVKVSQLLTDHCYPHEECSFAYAPPPHASRYEELLQCPVTFNAPQTRFVRSKQWVHIPLRGNNPEFNELCLRHCDQIVQQITRGSRTTTQLRSLFSHHPGRFPSCTEAARELRLSVRTLRRRLLDEGTSYQELINAYRLDMAKDHLKSTHMAPKEISYLLGFSSMAAFSRAFKSWTGKTVQQYRAEA